MRNHNKKITLYVDMDGTLCVFDTSKTIEEVASKGYCRNLQPITEVVNAITSIGYTDINIKILSAVINDGAIEDKKYWLCQNMGEKFANEAIFVPCGVDKSSAIEKDDDYSFLLDDFSKNLHDWKNGGGIGIKIYNGINGNHGTWGGYSVHGNIEAPIIFKQIMGIISAEVSFGKLF